MLEIDGNFLEGGGQILRISLALSAILGIPIRVTRVRAGRPKPGLAAQHLSGIKLVAEMCQAKTKGVAMGSSEIEFTPGNIRGQQYMAHIQTAGSVNLLLQAALPVALMADAPVSLDLRGGTDADMAPLVDYVTDVFRPVLNNFKADFNLQIVRRGYFPKGGGHVRVDVNPVNRLHNINMTDLGQVRSISGSASVTSGLPLTLAHRMVTGATSELQDLCSDVNIKTVEEQPHSSDRCSKIFIKCRSSTGYVLGEGGVGSRKVEAQQLGAQAAARMKQAIIAGACLDRWAQDQVIVYMALADGKSTVRVGEVTKHTKTAIYVAELMTKVKFTIKEKDGGNIIECTGIGFENKRVPE